MNHIITGHNLLYPKAIDAPLEFHTDPETVAECQKAVDAIAAKRKTGDLPQGAIDAQDIGLTFSDLENL